VWSDVLFGAERGFLLGMLAWAAASIVAGTAIIAWQRLRRETSPLLGAFGVTTAMCGVLEAGFAAARLARLAERDLAGAVRLDRMMWFGVGLVVGLAIAGALLAITSWRGGRRLGGVGCGIALTVQGFATMVLALGLIASISRGV
jgi:hypothetical protein